MQILSRTVPALLALVVGSAWGTYNYDPLTCPRMSIKASVPRNVRPGQIVTYKVMVSNDGPNPIHNLFVDAELPPYVVFPVPPKREGWGQKQSWTVSPKSLAYDRVEDLGSVIVLRNATVPVGKALTFRVRGKARDCLPESTNRIIQFKGEAYLIPPEAAQTCFIYAKPSNAVIKGSSKKTPECPPDVIRGVPIGAAAEVSGVATGMPLIQIPDTTGGEPLNPAQAAVRAQQRAAKAAWMNSSNGGSPDVVDDPLLQGASADDVRAANTIPVDFSVDGITNAPGAYGYTPPDPSHAVGLNHIVVVTNVRMAIYDKTTGAQIMAPKNINAVFSSLPTTDTCRTRNDGDPIAAWDHWNGRFVVSQFTVTSPYRQCIAVSKTADPTGEWWAYSVVLSTTDLYDYPKLSVMRDAYAITYNRFRSSYVGGAIILLDSAKMAAGQPLTTVYSWLVNNKWRIYGNTPLPGGSDNVQGPPPAGSAIPIASLLGSSSVAVMKLTWNFGAGTASIAGERSPWIVTVAGFTRLCSKGCVPQPSTSVRLDGLGDRLMNRLVYNHFGTYDSMVVTHSITTGVRFYEIRNINTNGGTPTLHQQGTIPNPTGSTRWQGTLAMDKAGNIAIGYAESGSSLFPSLSVSGRLSTDTLGTMPYGPTRVATGSGSLTCTCTRYGDYASMQVDPVDGCSFYLYHEYVPVAGTSDRGWGTRIVKFKMPGCV